MKRQKINKEALEALARLQCGLHEFACAFGVQHPLISNRIQELYDMTFSQFIEYYGAAGHTGLRRAMWRKALKGDTKMQIFLAKNHLGMAEKVESQFSNSGEHPFKIIVETVDARSKNTDD